MANKLILVDTSILIDYYRKTNKLTSTWIQLIDKGYHFSISAITKYELCSGSSKEQIDFWESILDEISIIPFDKNCVDVAIGVNKVLKRKRKQLDIADLFIASTALAHKLPLATLNVKHFERIEELTILS